MPARSTVTSPRWFPSAVGFFVGSTLPRRDVHLVPSGLGALHAHRRHRHMHTYQLSVRTPGHKRAPRGPIPDGRRPRQCRLGRSSR
eukprot:2821142-Lingulodinium_polyedra.AAC.1